MKPIILIMIKNFFSYVFELIKVVAISLAIIIPIRYYLIQPFYVKGASMEPNFYDKEYLIKRVIGLPGEKVQLKDGFVYIYNQEQSDGFKLEEKYLSPDLRTYGLNEE